MALVDEKQMVELVVDSKLMPLREELTRRAEAVEQKVAAMVADRLAAQTEEFKRALRYLGTAVSVLSALLGFVGITSISSWIEKQTEARLDKMFSAEGESAIGKVVYGRLLRELINERSRPAPRGQSRPDLTASQREQLIRGLKDPGTPADDFQKLASILLSSASRSTELGTPTRLGRDVIEAVVDCLRSTSKTTSWMSTAPTRKVVLLQEVQRRGIPFLNDEDFRTTVESEAGRLLADSSPQLRREAVRLIQFSGRAGSLRALDNAEVTERDPLVRTALADAVMTISATTDLDRFERGLTALLSPPTKGAETSTVIRQISLASALNRRLGFLRLLGRDTTPLLKAIERIMVSVVDIGGYVTASDSEDQPGADEEDSLCYQLTNRSSCVAKRTFDVLASRRVSDLLLSVAKEGPPDKLARFVALLSSGGVYRVRFGWHDSPFDDGVKIDAFNRAKGGVLKGDPLSDRRTAGAAKVTVKVTLYDRAGWPHEVPFHQLVKPRNLHIFRLEVIKPDELLPDLLEEDLES